MPRNSRQPARPHSSSFIFLAISLPIPFHPFFLETKKLPSPKGRELRFVFPPNFICPSPDIPLKVLSNPDPVSGASGKAYYRSARLTQKCTSAPYPCPLSLSGLAWPLSECLLFSSSLCCEYCSTGGGKCQGLFTLNKNPLAAERIKKMAFLRTPFSYFIDYLLPFTFSRMPAICFARRKRLSTSAHSSTVWFLAPSTPTAQRVGTPMAVV